MTLSPLNDDGKPVDWWFLYKLPKLTASATTEAARGYEYLYFDSAMAGAPAPALVKSPYTLDADHGALFNTLDQLFSAPTADLGWILYNDEVPPDGPTSLTLGHTKGVIGFDAASNTAFWLLHSWPKFPLPDDSAQPSPMYGQTFLCMALSLDTARELAKQMHSYQEPQVYDPRIPTNLADDDPLRLLTSGVTGDDPAGSETLDLASRGGTPFKVIAKNRNWNDDFWNNLVVDEIKASIDVDTWVNGPGAIPGSTDRSKMYSVEDMKFISFDKLGFHYAWPETRDHAKWAFSKSDNWICVGDINRKTTQRLRGGCTIAFQEPTLWANLSEVDAYVAPDGSGLTQKQMQDGVAKVAQANREALGQTIAAAKRTPGYIEPTYSHRGIRAAVASQQPHPQAGAAPAEPGKSTPKPRNRKGN